MSHGKKYLVRMGTQKPCLKTNEILKRPVLVGKEFCCLHARAAKSSFFWVSKKVAKKKKRTCHPERSERSAKAGTIIKWI